MRGILKGAALPFLIHACECGDCAASMDTTKKMPPTTQRPKGSGWYFVSPRDRNSSQCSAGVFQIVQKVSSPVFFMLLFSLQRVAKRVFVV